MGGGGSVAVPREPRGQAGSRGGAPRPGKSAGLDGGDKPLRTSLQQLHISSESIDEVVSVLDSFVRNPTTYPIDAELDRICESEYNRGALHALAHYIVACEAGQQDIGEFPPLASPRAGKCFGQRSPARIGGKTTSKEKSRSNYLIPNEVGEGGNSKDGLAERGGVKVAEKLVTVLKRMRRTRSLPAEVEVPIPELTPFDFTNPKKDDIGEERQSPPRFAINVNTGSLKAAEGGEAGFKRARGLGLLSPGRKKGENSTSPRRAPVRTGHWKLGHEIGKGSFGSVHIGLNEDTGDLIAVKVMSSHRPEMAETLFREIELMRHLRHPNIVCYLGAEVNDMEKTISIFQEWVPGSVTSLLENFGPFSDPRISSYTKQVLEGLAYLHSQRIIHRDIKGGNILIDDRGVVKLCDFGASKMLDIESFLGVGNHTRVGSPLFMAPEILLKEEYGPQVDIWSLGGAVLEMATGHPPWHTLNLRTPVALINWVKRTDGPPPLPDILSEPLRLFLLRCFVREPTKRATAPELRGDPFITQRQKQQPRALLKASASTSDVDSVSNIESLTRTAAIARIRRASRSDFSAPSSTSSASNISGGEATPRSPRLRGTPSYRGGGAGGANEDHPPTSRVSSPDSEPFSFPVSPPRVGSGAVGPGTETGAGAGVGAGTGARMGAGAGHEGGIPLPAPLITITTGTSVGGGGGASSPRGGVSSPRRRSRPGRGSRDFNISPGSPRAQPVSPRAHLYTAHQQQQQQQQQRSREEEEGQSPSRSQSSLSSAPVLSVVTNGGALVGAGPGAVAPSSSSSAATGVPPPPANGGTPSPRRGSTPGGGGCSRGFSGSRSGTPISTRNGTSSPNPFAGRRRKSMDSGALSEVVAAATHGGGGSGDGSGGGGGGSTPRLACPSGGESPRNHNPRLTSLSSPRGQPDVSPGVSPSSPCSPPGSPVSPGPPSPLPSLREEGFGVSRQGPKTSLGGGSCPEAEPEGRPVSEFTRRLEAAATGGVGEDNKRGGEALAGGKSQESLGSPNDRVRLAKE
ncbi:unnamed protein product [Discosporangium mesarthrocarpum]